MKHSRRITQLCVAVLNEVELYALADDGTVWKHGWFRDLNYWDQLAPLPTDEDPPPLADTDSEEAPGPLPRDRREALCAALRQLELGANIAELTTAEVVMACRAAVSDASSTEIRAALRELGRPW